MSVISDAEVVSFIAERGGRLYVWADHGGLKQVRTEAPADTSIPLKQVEAKGFRFYAATDMEWPEEWTVKLHHLPWPHLDVLWDGDQPGTASRVSVYP